MESFVLGDLGVIFRDPLLDLLSLLEDRLLVLVLRFSHIFGTCLADLHFHLHDFDLILEGLFTEQDLSLVFLHFFKLCFFLLKLVLVLPVVFFLDHALV